ncbi:MAG TPA: double-strand break repair helicase AddA [Aestuariivirgaceae bacterium]|nr:double-strand break repair helicase AddA [Aestuariivirgaceae bacterium]
MNRPDPREIANRNQAVASDPNASVWVSAHAGSGKTYVLVNRVIRLMLAGVPPERILCLTYTRAAAAEMSRRLFEVLSSWIPLDDDALIEHIHKISGYAKFGGELNKARRLFARALETPGGLKIQTIHAFCERLLQRFPVEAGVVPGFSVMDDVEARDVLAEVRRSVLAEARAVEGPAAAALAKVVAYAGDQQIDALVKELLAKRSELKRLLSDEGLRDGAIARLARFLGVPGNVSEETIWSDAVAGMDRAAYAAAADALSEAGGKADPKLGGQIRDTLAAGDPEQIFAALKGVFLTKEGERRKKLCTAATVRQFPHVDEHLASECDRIVALAEMERAVKVRDASAALFGFADQIIGRYENEKRRLGRYDYDDLIIRTLSMFRELEHAAWVLYKLDGGLDHILIDEAQDTSPEQWQIVQFLAEDFFTGEGRRPGVTRTIFAVGDRKQSIFSFQGADPDGFDAMQRYFKNKVQDARLDFETVRPTVSFRSTQTILDAVDAVFAIAAAADGVTEPGVADSLHQAVRDGPGLVEIWEPEKADDATSASPWQAGAARETAVHPRLRLARRIAATIRGWLDNAETLAGKNRPIRPGDILVLVRNRTTFMDALVRALKQENIEVAGADRLVLTSHIAIEDLLALARFALLPDDLTLASVLKSPLVARNDGAPIDDDDLYKLAWDRGSATLWEKLHETVSAGAPYGVALERLKRWRGAADFMPPYEFFSRVLTADGGRRAIMERLGSEAGEPLDAFLSLALDFAPAKAGALQAFLAALEDSGAEIKRDMDQGTNEVRVMTVHGAKGLEAPIVFLPDTCDPPTAKNDPAILFASDGPEDERIPLWRLKKNVETSGIVALREAQQKRDRQEYNRLLYVAMTRVRDRLYVGGCQTGKDLKEGCWYDSLSTALRPRATEVCTGDGQVVWRIEGNPDVEPEEADGALEQPIPAVEPPAWAMEMPEPEPAAMRWLIASHIHATGDDAATGERVASPLAGAAEHRFRRGRLIHSLLQSLPDVAPPDRAGAGERYLAHAAAELAPGERDAFLAEALAILAEPSLEALFAPGSLAEVPLAAVLGEDEASFGLTGQIDRLAVTDDEVLIADYKTNRPPPAAPEEADPLYIRQLAAYRAALARLYPGRPIRCVLVWTDGPRIMEIPARILDTALRLDGGRAA